MTRHPAFGLMLATFGALVLTPDALLLRLSGMAGPQMMGWRGIFMGTALIVIWLLTSTGRRRDLALVVSGYGAVIIICHFFNAMFFVLGIAAAPVAMVLLGIATTPVWAAILARVLFSERAGRATWLTICAVLLGIGVAVLGSGGADVAPRTALLGALAGLGVAMMLATNFAVLRARGDLPIALLIGIGALCAGAFGTVWTGPAQMPQGNMWAIAVTGCIVLPVSFLSLSTASRHTAAANVSLLLLLETVLAPTWVWLVLGEAMTPAMLLGGAVVVGAVALYLLHAQRLALRGRAKPTKLAAK